jgi:hypothetical protein
MIASSVDRWHGITTLDYHATSRQDVAMKPAKAMTLRLSAEQAEELATVASVDDLPVAEVVRTAIDEHIASRRRDEQFRRNLRERIEKAQRLLR